MVYAFCNPSQNIHNAESEKKKKSEEIGATYLQKFQYRANIIIELSSHILISRAKMWFYYSNTTRLFITVKMAEVHEIKDHTPNTCTGIEKLKKIV